MTSKLVACISCALLAACSVSPAGPCNDDSQCAAPAACDPGRHVCVLPCEPKCGAGQVCLSARCVQQGPVVRSVAAPATWTRRAGNVTVMATIDSGPDFKTASAALHVAGSADVAGTTSDAGAVRTYTFSVPASVQAAGSEAPVAFTIDAVDEAGHSSRPDAVGVGQLLIDDAPPQPGGVTVNGGVTGTDGLQWFKQAATAPIDAQVSVQDQGSGVNVSTLALMAGAVRLDNGTPQCAASTTSPAVLCHFFIDPQTPLVAPGGQGEIAFTVAGQDAAGNAMTVHQAKLGIDGKPPVITFAPAYPTAGADCNAGGGDPDNIFCGHDGSHFFRAGDARHSLSFVVNDASGDVGSGANPASGTCAIPGTTCTATFSAAGSTFSFPADFSAATFSSAADGTGDVQVTVNATDLVGNAAAPVQVAVHVTRVKWMRTMAGKVDTFKGSPVATTVPVPQVIFAGVERDNVGGPIASIGPDGTVLWRTGHGDIATISNNVAYSSATKRLYVLGDSAAKMFGYAVVAAGITSSYSCVFDDGTTAANAIGAPSVVPGTPERILASDSVGRLWSLAGTPGSGCAGAGNSFTNSGGQWATLNQPTVDGSIVMVPHDGTKLSTLAFAGGTFSPVTDAPGFAINVFGPVSIADAIYFGEIGTVHLYSYSRALASNWAPGKAPMAGQMNASVVVGPTYVFGSPTATDGQLHAFLKADGGEAWHWPLGAAKAGNISAPSIGADGIIYFSSDNPKQLIPLKVSTTLPATPSLAPGWAEFKGSALQKTTTLVDTTVDSLTTEPVIDSSGVIYFGTTAGKVFALITDSGGPLPPVPGQTWPRVGFDNCNSSNTAFACQ